MKIKIGHPMTNLVDRWGLTLVETLVVVGIIGILLGLIIPAVQNVRASAARAECASKIRQVGLAIFQFEENRRHLPQGCYYPYLKTLKDIKNHSGISWQTLILPFLEQEKLWKMAWEAHQVDPIGRNQLHFLVRSNAISVFMCPTEHQTKEKLPNGITAGLVSYLGVAGTKNEANDGIFHRNFRIRYLAITDGTSNTLMVGERPPGPNGIFGTWYAAWGYSVCNLTQILQAGYVNWIPSHASNCETTISTFRPGRTGDACDLNHYWSFHPGGANFLFADGSVRFLSYSANSILPALATRAGGEIVQIP